MPNAAAYPRLKSRLLGLARCHIGPTLRPKVDPEDIADSVIGSFIRMRGAAALNSPAAIEDVWNLLARICRNKCAELARKYGRECPGDRILEGKLSLDTPEAVALLRECKTRLWSRLAYSQKKVLLQFLRGDSTDEIAQHLAFNLRKVQRALERIYCLLEDMNQEAFSSTR